MLLLGQLAKIQGLKGEFLFHPVMDDPDRLEGLEGLILAPPTMNLEHAEAAAPALPVKLRIFRWHQDRPCVAFDGITDRTAAEAFKGWALWMPESQAALGEGESFRHQWIGTEVSAHGALLGEVMRLDPTPMGYDLVVIRDRRPGRRGTVEIPYIKAWWTLDLAHGKAAVEAPEGLLDLHKL